jgi:hypothetical protein
MQKLEQTRAKIVQEQLVRAQMRKNELRIQARREALLVRDSTQTLEDRTQTLSHLLFEARRDAFLMRERTETLSRSVFVLSRLCFLLCVCLACSLLHHYVASFDQTWTKERVSGRQEQTTEENSEASHETGRRVQLEDNSKSNGRQAETRFRRPLRYEPQRGCPLWVLERIPETEEPILQDEAIPQAQVVIDTIESASSEEDNIPIAQTRLKNCKGRQDSDSEEDFTPLSETVINMKPKLGLLGIGTEVMRQFDAGLFFRNSAGV